VLDEDSEELLINPNMMDDERHKRNVEKRKQKSDYTPYDEDTLDEHGMVSYEFTFIIIGFRSRRRTSCLNTMKVLTGKLSVRLFVLINPAAMIWIEKIKSKR
jgi:hypothetical protein